MARVLIVYDSKHGQTEKISKFIRDRMTAQGHAVELLFAGHALPVAFSKYDGVIVGAPIYMRTYPRHVRSWVKTHAERLNTKPSAFFTVCLGVIQADERSQRDLVRIGEAFFARTGWYPKRRKVFAGAARFSQYNWFVKLIMKFFATRSGAILDADQDYEFTQWSQVTHFSDEFIHSLKMRKSSRTSTVSESSILV